MGIRILYFSVFLLSLVSLGFSNPRCHRRVITINPPTLFDPLPFGFKHISLDTRNSIAYIAGQVSVDLTGSVVGSTLDGQLPLVEKNVKLAMDAVGADISDILQMMAFVKDLGQAIDLSVLQGTFQRFGNPVVTLVSIPSLAFPDLLVEIQVTVAVPNEILPKLVGSCTKSFRTSILTHYSGHAYAMDGDAEVIPISEEIEQKEDVVQ